MTVDFNTIYPWAGMETVTIDGQTMKKIPKFWLKVGKAPASAKYPGKKCYWISDRPREGYHVHPSFIKNGDEMDCFYIGAYEAYNDNGKAGSAAGKTPWVSIDNPAAIAACAARNVGGQEGWHLQTIYERAAVSLLMMIEIGTPNAQTEIAAGNVSSSAAQATGATAATWRGIHEWWGNVWEHTDGFKTDANSMGLIFSNRGDGSYVFTGVPVAAGWIKETSEATGTNFDMNDVFVPSVADGTEGNGTFGDYSWVAANCVLYQSGDWDNGTQDGAFVSSVNNAASNSNTDLGFRVAKYGTTAN